MASLISVVVPKITWACTCGPKNVNALFENSPIVIAGRVITTTREQVDVDDYLMFSRLRVMRVWKGITRRDAIVQYTDIIPLCSVSLEIDQTYLFYTGPADANQSGPSADISTSRCGYPTPLQDAADDFQIIGQGLPLHTVVLPLSAFD